MRIWLVEDDDLVSIPLAMWMERIGHEVTTFRRPQDAVATAASGQAPDLLVTDLTMPGMSGTALIQRVRERAGPVPAILTSGYDIDRDAVDAGEPFAFLPKPIDLDRFAEAILGFAGPRGGSVHSEQ